MGRTFEDLLLAELWRAYGVARKGKRRTEDEHKFEVNDFENIVNLRDDIIERTYRPSRGVAFVVRDPVTREIFAAPFRDRVVHHLIYNQVSEWWDKRLLPDSYSCRVGKGTLYGQKRIAAHIQGATNNFQGSAFFIKADLQGYFMSLDREKIFSRVVWGLERQFPDTNSDWFRTLKYLWKEIIFDNPTRGVKIRGRWSDWDDLPNSKSLFYQEKGHGIVIGNLTSQMLSNYYLDQLDRFIHFKLGYRYYGRYVDDFVIIVPMEKKQQLIRDLEIIRDYIQDLGLVLHPKKLLMQDVRMGIPFIGAVIYPGRILPSRRIRKSCREKWQEVAEGRGKIETVVSHLGLLKHIDSYFFTRGVFEGLGWER